jgi:hypothetical protein
VDGAGAGEFFEGYGLSGVEAFLLDPRLDRVEVDGGEFFGEAGEMLRTLTSRVDLGGT